MKRCTSFNIYKYCIQGNIEISNNPIFEDSKQCAFEETTSFSRLRSSFHTKLQLHALFIFCFTSHFFSTSNGKFCLLPLLCYILFDIYGIFVIIGDLKILKYLFFAFFPKKMKEGSLLGFPLFIYALFFITTGFLPALSIACAGHFAAHRPQLTHFELSITASAPFMLIACLGQTFTHI